MVDRCGLPHTEHLKWNKWYIGVRPQFFSHTKADTSHWIRFKLPVADWLSEILISNLPCWNMDQYQSGHTWCLTALIYQRVQCSWLYSCLCWRDEFSWVLAWYVVALNRSLSIQGMTGAIKKAGELTKEGSGMYMLQQFNNPANPAVHFRTTGPEIWDATDGRIDILVAGVHLLWLTSLHQFKHDQLSLTKESGQSEAIIQPQYDDSDSRNLHDADYSCILVVQATPLDNYDNTLMSQHFIRLA